MLSSKELLEITGISRATLNNYIAHGILPRPVIKEGGGRTRRLGYFPNTATQTIEEVNRLKRLGLSIDRVAESLRQGEPPVTTPAPAEVPATTPATPPATPMASVPPVAPQPAPMPTGGFDMRLSLAHVDQPVYLVNPMLELEWCNAQAERELFGYEDGISGDITARGLFKFMLGENALRHSQQMDDLIRFHLSAAKNRLPKATLLAAAGALGDMDGERLLRLYDEAEPAAPGQVHHIQVNLAPRGEADAWFNVYASFFREGTLYAYSPIDAQTDNLMALLSRRDIVIRDVLKNRRPYLTPLAVLVADLQNSVKICADLPAEEYFELINEIWAMMEPKIRKYYATHGKHVGDGMLYYFFPQPDCSYVMNAIQCALEMKDAMRDIDAKWRKRKNWDNTLILNTGLVEGQEWFGTYQTPTHIEFTVLGDTINIAGRLSDFARNGAIWASKGMLSNLDYEQREHVDFGIRRKLENGSEIVVGKSYSRISNLVDLENPQYIKFRDIAVLAATEIFSVE